MQSISGVLCGIIDFIPLSFLENSNTFVIAAVFWEKWCSSFYLQCEWVRINCYRVNSNVCTYILFVISQKKTMKLISNFLKIVHDIATFM